MKTIVKALVLVFAIATVPSFAAVKSHSTVKVLSTRNYIFYFKIDKSFIGSTVEVTNSEGTVVQTEKVAHAKNIVDFFYLAPGDYTITIKKDGEEYVFHYENKE